MLLISARDGFWSDTKLAVKDAARNVDLVGSAPSKVVANPITELTATANKKVLLLIHGYNNEPEDVHNAYAVIDKMVKSRLSGKYGHVAGYIWPGGDDGLDYWAAKTRANALARRVGILLHKLTAAGATVDLMAHSMGCRVALKALKTRSSKVARNVFALAAAVDNESVEKGEEFYKGTQRCQNFFVFHSKHDSVLNTAYRAAEFDSALGLRGPENPETVLRHSSPKVANTPNVYVANCKHRVRRHGAYKDLPALYSYIKAFDGPGTTEQYVTL